jgi:uncharacterized RDD family membrane protein YckC
LWSPQLLAQARKPRFSIAMPHDSTLSAQTPEGIAYTVYPAGIAARALAYAIDTVITWVLIIALEIFASSIRDESGYWFMLLLLFVFDWFFHFFFEVFWQGQSPGKKVMGVRVVLRDGSPVSAQASFLRNLLRFADTFFMFYQIAFVVISGTKGFKRIGDIVASTIVVYTSQARAPLKFRLMPAAYKIDEIEPPRRLSFGEKQALLMFARRYPLLGASRGDEIVKAWTDSLGFKPYSSETRALCPSEYALGIAKKYHGSAK